MSMHEQVVEDIPAEADILGSLKLLQVKLTLG